jgi:hypothetical protein
MMIGGGVLGLVDVVGSVGGPAVVAGLLRENYLTGFTAGRLWVSAGRCGEDGA